MTPLTGAAFGVTGYEDRGKIYAAIPDDTDVLVTHSPPYGVLDLIPLTDIHTGRMPLSDAVKRFRPRLHVYGHCHGSYGMYDDDHTVYVNGALLGIDGGIERAPVVLRIPRMSPPRARK